MNTITSDMSMKLVGIALVGLTALAFAGCSDGESTAGTSGGSAGTGTGGNEDAATGGSAATGGNGGIAGSAGAAVVTLSGLVVEGQPGNFGSEPLLDGVEVCVVDRNGQRDTAVPCVTTNTNGEYDLAGLSPDTRVIATFVRSGFVSQAIAIDVASTDFVRAPSGLLTRLAAVRMPTPGQTLADWGVDPSVVQDTSKSMVSVFALLGFSWTSGVSFDISPASGDGPFYQDSGEKFVSGASATQGGWGGYFVNLEPGEYVITATSRSRDCRAVADNGFGWPEGDHSVRFPVLAGLGTQGVGFQCMNADDGGADARVLDASADALSD